VSAQNELSALIARTVEEQTFSLQAIEAIGKIREKALALERSLASTEAVLVAKDRDIGDRDRKLAVFGSREAELVARESAVAARETKIAELEKTTAVAQGKFDVLQGVFHTVFANRIVREQTLTSTPIAQGTPGGASYVSNFETRNTIDRTEG
jgi:uncharacterized protein (DUF3084 family)